MALPGFHSPSASFEQPFDLLGACHERVHRTLELLKRLQLHLSEKGCDEQARQAAVDVMRYFDIAAPLHHEDEELHVFPPLLKHAPQDVKLLVRKLQEDHRHMLSSWAQARATLQEVATGSAENWHPLRLQQTASLQHFADLYDSHIAAEDQIAYPRAREYLTPQDIQAMQADMMQRRGVKTKDHNVLE